MSRLHRDITVSTEARQARRLQDLEDGAIARLQPQGPRQLGGWVGPSGEVLIAGGFSVEHTGTGDYVMNFINPFHGNPIITATAISNSRVPVLISFGTTFVWIRWVAAGGLGGVADTGFMFTARENIA